MTLEASSLDYVEGFWRALDEVARERKYLLFTEGPEMEGTRSFLKEIQEKGWTQFFAVDEGEVVGWCDVCPYSYEGCTHVGHLGMGVVASRRGEGIGEALIRRAVKEAFGKGIERIELEVFSTNVGAISLYEKVGFVHEGRKVKARRIDGVEHDNLMMALFREG